MPPHSDRQRFLSLRNLQLCPRRRVPLAAQLGLLVRQNLSRLGPSAHSYDGDQRIYSVNNLEKYIELAGTDRIYGREILSRIDKYNEYIMTALRTDYGIRRDALSERFGFKGLLYFEYCAGKFLRNGLIVREGNVYRIPPEKLMVSNSIISDLFYIEE